MSEAELALIGSLLDEPDYCRAAARAVSAEDIVSPIGRAVLESYVNDGKHDPVSLATNVADQLGEGVQTVLAYLEEAKESPHSSENVEEYAALVRDAAIKRRAVYLMNRSITHLMEGGSTDSVVAETVSGLRSVLPKQTTRSIADVVDQHYQKVEAYHADPVPEGQVRGLSSGLQGLDRMLGGLETALYILGARPSRGKTALATHILVGVARQFVNTDRVALYFTNEMNDEQLLERIACSGARVSRRDLRAGHLSHRDLQSYYDVLAEISALPIELIYTRRLSDVLARCYKDPKPGFVVVDYLNKMLGGHGENRNQRFGDIASSIFDAAYDLDIPIFLLSQLGRETERRAAGGTPKMYDLRDSGELEQDADVILLLHREIDEESARYDPRRLTVLKRKDRLGGGQNVATTLYFGVHGDVRDIPNGRAR